MQLIHVHGAGERRLGALEQGVVHVFSEVRTIAGFLAEANLWERAQKARQSSRLALPLSEVEVLPPVDHQEVWAAGVTYKRSKIAREEESVGAAQFYDKVYSAPRPELFLKAAPHRAVGPNHPVRIRKDSSWNVPEPELALVINPRGEIVGYTIGNDMSSRDIEGENPLYLPQAKIYKDSCSLGPVITLKEAMPPLAEVEIQLTIERNGIQAFHGTTSFQQFHRTPEELVSYLYRELDFPHGAVLLTGTGIVPPDNFSLKPEDIVHIDITGLGRLTNPVYMA